MTITITRTPRDDLLLRRNDCINPRLGSYNNWTSTGFGTNGTGNDTYSSSVGSLEKYWTNTPTNVAGAGWYYRDNTWNGDFVTKAASAEFYLNGFEPQFQVRFNFYNRDGGLLSVVEGGIYQLRLSSGYGWQRVWGTAKSPAGTAYCNVEFRCVQGNNPQNNQGIAMRRVLIEATDQNLLYFDGSTYANGNGTQHTAWEGSADASRSLLYDVDPNNVITPNFVDGWRQTHAGRNTFYETLDGNQAVVWNTSSWRRGVLRLLFDGNGVSAAAALAAALNAEAQHKKRGVFTYLDDTLGGAGSMTYAVDGELALYPTESRFRWWLEVPYRAL